MSGVLERAHQVADGHPLTCLCFECCLLVGAGERRAVGELADVKVAIDASLWPEDE